MKIRNGFVSNSSSASFIVKVNLNKEGVLNCLISEFDISKNCYLSTLNEELIDITNQKNTSIVSNEFYDEHINSIKQLIQNVNNSETNEEVLELYLRAHGVDVNSGLNDWTEILSHTLMFNDYNDMPSELKHLITYFMFEHSEIKLICNINND